MTGKHGMPCLHCALSMMLQGAIHQGKDPMEAIGEILQVVAEVIASQKGDAARDRLLQQTLQHLHREAQQAIFDFAQQGRYADEEDAAPPD